MRAVAPWRLWRTQSAPERAPLLPEATARPAAGHRPGHTLRTAMHNAWAEHGPQPQPLPSPAPVLEPTASHSLHAAAPEGRGEHAAAAAAHHPGHGLRTALHNAWAEHGPHAAPPPPPPTGAAALVGRLRAQAPHARLDQAIADLTAAGAVRLHGWLLRPELRDRPGLLLALSAIAAATLGAANLVYERGAAARGRCIDRPGREAAAGFGAALGPFGELAAALGVEALSLSAGVGLACATGLAAAVTVAVTAPMIALPIAMLPARAKRDLSRVLRAYLFVEQPRGHVIEGLQHDLTAVMDYLHAGHVRPPPPQHFADFAQWVQAHPVFSRRVGLPEPHPARIAVVHRGVVAMHWPAWLHAELPPTPTAPTGAREPNAPHRHSLLTS